MPLTLTSTHTHPSMQVGYKDPKDDLHSYWGEKKITNGRNWVYAACLPMINPQITHLSPVDLLLLSAQPVPPPHHWLMSQSSPSYWDTIKAQMGRTMDVIFYSLLQQTPKHQTCPFAMNCTQPKASLPHLPLANDPTLVKQRSM